MMTLVPKKILQLALCFAGGPFASFAKKLEALPREPLLPRGTLVTKQMTPSASRRWVPGDDAVPAGGSPVDDPDDVRNHRGICVRNHRGWFVGGRAPKFRLSAFAGRNPDLTCWQHTTLDACRNPEKREMNDVWGNPLCDFTPFHQASKAFVAAKMKEMPDLLEFVGPTFQSDPEVVWAAVSQKPAVLRFAARDLLTDPSRLLQQDDISDEYEFALKKICVSIMGARVLQERRTDFMLRPGLGIPNFGSLVAKVEEIVATWSSAPLNANVRRELQRPILSFAAVQCVQEIFGLATDVLRIQNAANARFHEKTSAECRAERQRRVFLDPLMGPKKSATSKGVEEPQIHVLGDIHGSPHDYLAAIKHFGQPSKTNRFVLLGDYSDRGRYNLEGLLLPVLRFVLHGLDAFVLLRGNHESVSLAWNRDKGTADEVFSTPLIREMEERQSRENSPPSQRANEITQLKNTADALYHAMPRTAELLDAQKQTQVFILYYFNLYLLTFFY